MPTAGPVAPGRPPTRPCGRSPGSRPPRGAGPRCANPGHIRTHARTGRIGASNPSHAPGRRWSCRSETAQLCLVGTHPALVGGGCWIACGALVPHPHHPPARARGARVYAGPEPEVGMLPVRLTPEGSADPVLGTLPSEFTTLQWHGDTFDLPEGAVLLAGSAPYTNPACPFG